DFAQSSETPGASSDKSAFGVPTAPSRLKLLELRQTSRRLATTLPRGLRMPVNFKLVPLGT
ncbi:MAG TPA: hypothetical protein VHS80_12350, partial [Chthoniobacterales bacterium]|nr:hypothetical protein [Chthoniobacterales bacterium]